MKGTWVTNSLCLNENKRIEGKIITRSNNQTYISVLCKGSYKRICVIFIVALKFLVKLAQNKVVVNRNSFSLRWL